MNRRRLPARGGVVLPAFFLALSLSCGRTPDRGAGRDGGSRTGNPAARLPSSQSVSQSPAQLWANRSPPPLPPASDADLLPPAAGLPSSRQAIQVAAGVERVVDVDRARADGLTVVDLSDSWAPAVFADGTAPDGTLLPNRYRAVFTGLASDRTDGDGQPLSPGEKNYLELYGIPPTLSVLRERFVSDAGRTCDPTFDVGKLLAVDSIETWGATTEQKELGKRHFRAQRLEAVRAQADAESLEALAIADPRYAKDVKAHRRAEAEQDAFAEIEKRLACEGLLDLTRHKAGRYDSLMRKAMFDFQQKHTVIDQADIRRSTLETLSRPLLFNDYAALRRVLGERVAHAAGIVEDGSASTTAGAPATYLGSDGVRHPVPDLITPATDALMARLGLGTPQDALAFFVRHPAQDFRSLRAAVRLAPLPEYYAAEMNLSAEIDRGDIWYDFPFNEAGVRQPQPRERFPSFTLFVKWRGERVPLCRWRTTIGGWRSELASDGQEYFRYKDSDVGPRVWRHIVAAPVWIPPPSSPLGSMVKEKKVNGMFVKVTNYDETGPGYLSAYGLAAAIHEQMHKGPDGVTYFDNGIRTHGSFDYMSLRGRFSHGCHRLYNNLAVRLFSFVLRHRRVRTLGPIALGFRRSFFSKGEVFELRLPSRGFYFELTPPLPVETLEGRIKGTRPKPLAGYLRKPGVKYAAQPPPPAANSPESKAGGVEAP
ncbi:MAG: hypothetical protein QOI66_3627 [Myxococcales bacterium]|nr:hypothetical protein [Myxococcales bacterium]